MPKANPNIIPVISNELILRKIYMIRGQKVILDEDIATLYEVETKRVNEQVKRNISRFPEDFMFQLSIEEFENLKSQIATSSWGGRRKLPFAFTEQGVAMLSGVISSDKAIHMNIAIMRAFVEIRKITINNKSITRQIQVLRKKMGEHDEQLNQIYETLENLLDDQVERKTWENRR